MFSHICGSPATSLFVTVTYYTIIFTKNKEIILLHRDTVEALIYADLDWKISQKDIFIEDSSTNTIDCYSRINKLSVKSPPFLMITVRPTLLFALRLVSVPFQSVPAGKRPPKSYPPAPGQWPA